MRRLLLVSYFFPPEPSSGSRRPGALARYLPDRGWEVDVVVRRPDARTTNGRLVVVPYRPLIERLREDLRIRPDLWFRAPPQETWSPGVVEPPRSFAGRSYHFFRRTALMAALWPDRTIGWHFSAIRGLRDHLRERPPDAVISTSPPETAHFIGRWISRTTGAIWVADLRDPWASSHLADRPRWRRVLDARAERAVLREADTLVTVSGPIAEETRDRLGRRVEVIRNGYDPDVFPGAEAPDRTRFTLLYAGAVTTGRHDLGSLAAGLRRFLESRSDARSSFELRFLGEEAPAVRGAFAGLEAAVRFEGRSPHADAAAAMRRSAANLFLLWQDSGAPGVYSGKLFEYLGARRPVLAVGAIAGVAGALLEETGAGRIARDAGEVASRLAELYDAHRAGRDAWSPAEEKVLEHSHEHMVARFARVLDEALERRSRYPAGRHA